MSYFTTISAAGADGDLDLTKHVNFTSGMILGVDDFTQEFAYLAGRDRWLARDALGYGTISGLSVQIEKDAEKGHRVMILPGAAISPRGQFICVPAAQCAYLNQWLAAARAEDLLKYVKTVNAVVTSPPPVETNEITLYVVLCYRDCATDNVPIPGEPCRSEDELTAASRITDDFSLELRFEPPNQPEETKLREYVEWLKKIKISETDASTPIADFIEAIRARWLAPASPPTDLQIRATDIGEYMRTAFRLWVTELRAVLSERKTGCAVEMTGGAKLEDCILLAELRVPLVPISPGWKVSDTKEIETNEKNRPFLLHLRMLQEWMLYSYEQTLGNAPITSPTIPTVHNHSLNSLSDVAVSPAEGQILIFENGKWIAKTQVSSGGGVTGTAGGDLTGDYPNPTVSQLQKNPVAEQTPTKNDILTWDGAKWIPKAVPADSTPFPLLLPLATITVGKPSGIFDIWFNIDALTNAAEIRKEDLDIKHITPQFELEAEINPTSPFLQKIEANALEFGRISRNLFRIQLNGVSRETPKLRFDFDIENINVFIGGRTLSVQKYARKNNIRFLGEIKNKVTIFVRFS